MDVTIKNIAQGFLNGFIDSIVKGISVIFYIDRENNKKLEKKINLENEMINDKTRKKPAEQQKKQQQSNVGKRVLECCTLNGLVFWCNIILFEYGLMPFLNFIFSNLFFHQNTIGETMWLWLKPILTVVFNLFWILPLFLLSRIVNSLWFQDIADSAYAFRKGRPQLIPSISKLIADTLFSLLVQALFLVQSMLVSLIPINYFGIILSFIHMCLLNSLYSFEYKWFNMGWELHKRLAYIECNWPYFIGFGMPLALVTHFQSSYILSGCIFAMLFPLFILSANEATPVINTCDFSLRLFSPVILISNKLVSKTMKSPGPSKPAHTTVTSIPSAATINNNVTTNKLNIQRNVRKSTTSLSSTSSISSSTPRNDYYHSSVTRRNH